MLLKSKRSYSNRSFGYFISLLLIATSLIPIFFNNSIKYEALILSAISLLLSFFYSKIFHIPAELWFRLGSFLHFIFSPIILILIYFIAIIIPGMLCKIFNRQTLSIKYDFNKDSYWIDKKYIKNNKTNLKDMY
jgi:hypothetical protein